MKELNDEEMQGVDGGKKWERSLATDGYTVAHYFYPKKSLVKQTDGNYKYDKTKGVRTKLNNKGKIKINVKETRLALLLAFFLELVLFWFLEFATVYAPYLQ